MSNEFSGLEKYSDDDIKVWNDIQQSFLIPSYNGVPLIENEHLTDLPIADENIDQIESDVEAGIDESNPSEIELPIVPLEQPVEQNTVISNNETSLQDHVSAAIRSLTHPGMEIDYGRIRYVMGQIYQQFGYPVKFGYHVDYYSGVAMWILDDWQIDDFNTRNLWNWRPQFKWKRVFVEYLGTSAIRDVPIVGYFFSSITSAYIHREVEIYDNLLFKNTIANELIVHNKQKIIDELSKWLRGNYTQDNTEITNDRIGVQE
jgi:hypothetical protein